MADLATLQSRLDEAEAAYHRLMLPETVSVEVTFPDRSKVVYAPANLPALLAYISTLRMQVAQASGHRVRRSIVLGFGS